MDPFTIIGGAISIGSSVFSAIEARKQQLDAESKERDARRQMQQLENQYKNLDTSNPFLNMENTMEDLTINQQQAEFQAQQFQQSQANIMRGLRSAVGTSGVAALAQSLAQQGEIAAASSSASIGAQEAANQRLQAAQASKLQAMERQGEVYSRNLQRQKVGTLLGMAQQRTAAYAQQAGAARAQMMSSIASGAKGAATMFAGFGEDKKRPLFGMEGSSDDFTTMMTDIGKTTGDNFDDMDFQGKLNFLKEQYPNMSDEQKSLIPNFILQELDLD